MPNETLRSMLAELRTDVKWIKSNFEGLVLRVDDIEDWQGEVDARHNQEDGGRSAGGRWRDAALWFVSLIGGIVGAAALILSLTNHQQPPIP